MENVNSLPPVLLWVFLAIMGGYFFIKLKKRRGTSDVVVVGSDYEVFLSFRGLNLKKRRGNFQDHPYQQPSSNPSSSSSDFVVAGSDYEAFSSFRGSDLKKKRGTSQTNPVNSYPSNPSSSSSDGIVAGSDYEVFLSFRGSDTRTGFTDYLYTSLKDAGIRAFRDNEELRVGEEIGENLLEAITESKICIPIFSKDYASSKWCLKEMAHMLKCKNQLVLPIFYDVTPHQVRHQSGTYEESFKLHTKRYDEKTVEEWRNALAEIGGLKGWELQNVADGREGELVKKVISVVWRELKKAHLIVKDSIVGIEDGVEEVMGMLKVGSSDVRIVGIHGIGGIGKTTLAKIIYNQLLEHFEYSSFLKDVREMSLQPKGLEKLQTQLLSDILKSKNLQHEFPHVDEGVQVLKERVQKKKVLILLDDVDEKDQINALAAECNWFGEGSRIIITTRNKDVLDASQVKRSYEVRPMHSNEALLLFCMHAFKRESPAFDYADLSKNIVSTTGGLPLALEVIGSFLYLESRSVWEETLEKLQNGPYKDVQDKLRISYEALEYEQKQIFLDIACFFIGTDKRIASYMWKDCQLYPNGGIKVLLQRSLIKVGDDNKFWMHDQLRDLGKEIVREENHKKPGERSRLWSGEEAMHVLHYQQGTENIEAIHLDFRMRSGYISNSCNSMRMLHYQQKKGTENIQATHLNFQTRTEDNCLTREQVMKLLNLRFLRLNGANVVGDLWRLIPKLRWLQWHNSDVVLMATNLALENLVILDLSNSNVTDDWRGWNSRQLAIKLKVLILESCDKLHKSPDLSEFHSLERLSLRGCRYLHKVDPSIGKLKNLIFLSLENCFRLQKLPEEMSYLQALVEIHLDGSGVGKLSSLNCLKKLELLSVKRCELLYQVPPSIGHFTSLLELSLDDTHVHSLPDSIGALVKLRRLSLSNCSLLKELPDSIGELCNLQVLLVDHTGITNVPRTLGMLEKLEVIDFLDCRSLCGEISIDLVRLGSLTTLTFGGTNITMLPANINRLPNLETLNLAYCDALQTLPQLPSSLRYLSVTCRQMEAFPDFSIYTNLLELRLMRCSKLKRITGLGSLTFLRFLMVSNCQELAVLDGLEKLEFLRELSISRCESLEKLSNIPKSKQLEMLKLESCKSLQSIMNLSALKMLRHLSLIKCKKLRELQGLEELKSLKRVNIGYSPSLYLYTEQWPHIPWVKLPRVNIMRQILTRGVYLSFRDQDIINYVDESRGLSAFRDEAELDGYLLDVINKSKIYIPIFSKGYAFNIRCLQELAHIMECNRNWNRFIWPIFYDVAPDQVQEQSGSYQDAFKQHMKHYDAKIVEVWRAALREIGALKGWELQHVDDEPKELLVETGIVSAEGGHLYTAYRDKIKNHVEEFMKSLDIDTIGSKLAGMFGPIPINKSTIRLAVNYF